MQASSQRQAPPPTASERVSVSIDSKRLGGHPTLYGRFGEEKNLLPLPVFESRNQVAVSTTFSCVLYNCHIVKGT